MTDDSAPADGTPVTFAVPISEPFARAAAQVLKDLRELAAGAFPEEVGGPDAPFRRDAAAFDAQSEPTREARRSMHGMIFDLAQLSWSNALDHVRALEQDVVMQPPPVWSPLTLSRAVMENCLFLHYLIDPDITGAKRLARCAGLWRTDVEHMEKAAKAFGPTQVAEIAKTKDYVLTALGDVGAVERTNPQGRLIGYEVDGEKSGLDINITEEAKAMPSHLPAPYRILSGAAHGRPWMTNRARMLAEDSNDDLVGEAATVMTAVAVVTGALETALKAWRDYFGLDLGDSLEHLNGLYRMFFIEAVNLGVESAR
ncbi:hypothetical protein PV733_28155 [Streptomyces europaeiscabiei]|uniref:hypothetical protein n=1 Tax=Streptomyces europaeiscabiei TaxID=146819 RepID=UPI0029AE9754|nr:hypothetical protein [Streptomyces europaeiscabiei]MDX3712744.1 hypothetical protein [Streptomyces europaeiscabiei]